MSANCSMHAGSWTKLTLTELKDLCAACGLSVEGDKEELEQEPGPRNADDRTGEVVDVDLDEDGGGEFEDDLNEDSQEADNRIREEFAAYFRGKEKVKEIEDGDGLDEAWPKVKLSRPHDQHEYDFLAKIGRRLDKAIRILPESNRKEFVGVREEVESRAVTLRLADNRGWGTALQIVESNDKMMEKYKDCIPLFSQAGQSSCLYEWGYRRKA
ncbi:11132_t:CDS:2 [Dentiscutata erythropus]|uniref:11132_t:CDS:1 n=1 Tax=Dentiscutata erythropus TaxID=1348616 RepID=A0A9N9IPJ0_9GLOM|nr:11132_t:CDS:2 [Dentiscutata erythropus]